MLALVVMVFILCWSPLLIFNILQAFDIIPIGKQDKANLFSAGFVTNRASNWDFPSQFAF
jgi:hypothetical protein